MKNEDLNPEVGQHLIEKWGAATTDEPNERPHMPVRALQGEANDLAELIEKNFATVGERLGLDSLVGRGGFSAELPTELRELGYVIGIAQSRYHNVGRKISDAPLERADAVLTELRASLGYLLAENEVGEDQLQRLREEYDDAYSHDGIALALQNYAELAVEYEADLKTLPGFDYGVVSEAMNLSQALRQRSADRLAGNLAVEQREMMDLRNRLISGLMKRMGDARRAIRFVFRTEPEIVLQAGSAYLRDQKRKYRKTQSDAPKSGITGTEDTMEIRTPNLQTQRREEVVG